jgi:hypothetical protein
MLIECGFTTGHSYPASLVNNVIDLVRFEPRICMTGIYGRHYIHKIKLNDTLERHICIYIQTLPDILYVSAMFDMSSFIANQPPFANIFSILACHAHWLMNYVI